MGHSSTPKGLSRVGMGKGTDLRTSDDIVRCQCAEVLDIGGTPMARSWTVELSVSRKVWVAGFGGSGGL